MEKSSVSLQGHVFDGRTSQIFLGSLQSTERGLCLTFANQTATYALADVKIGARIGRIPRSIDFPDGRRFETDQQDLIDQLAQQKGDSTWINKLERNWPFALGAAASLVLFVVVSYLYLLPRLADKVAPWVPERVVRLISTQAQLMIEHSRIFQPSTLSLDERRSVDGALSRVQTLFPHQTFQVLVRGGGAIGANAFALPDGTLYVTDEIIDLAQDENHLYAILLHEAGHVRHQHSLKLLIANSGLALILFTMVGGVDISGLPLVLLSSSYSREYETEADDFAATELKKQGLSPKLLVEGLERLAKQHVSSGKIPAFLSSHPLTEERIRRLNAIKP